MPTDLYFVLIFFHYCYHTRCLEQHSFIMIQFIQSDDIKTPVKLYLCHIMKQRHLKFITCIMENNLNLIAVLIYILFQPI
jgi:hypothetical protein